MVNNLSLICLLLLLCGTIVSAEECLVSAPVSKLCEICEPNSALYLELNFTFEVTESFLGRVRNIKRDNNCTSFTFDPYNIGIDTIDIKMGINATQTVTLVVTWKGDVSQIIFKFIIVCCITVIIFCFGCELDLDLVWGYIKRPILPLIGMGCQYAIMPLVALVIYSVTPLTAELGLGLFTLAASPGGFGSNIWCVILEGDLNLSSTMTFLSTVLSPAMMLLWLNIFQRFFLGTAIRIPYMPILVQLLQIVIPLVLGALLAKYCPKVKAFLIRLGRILIGVFFVTIVSLGTYVNLHIYRLLQIYPFGLFVGAFLSWLAFALSYGFSFLVIRLNHKLSLTIALETSIQNIGIAMIILRYTMPQPQGDIGSMIPILSGFTVLIPLWMYWAIVFAPRKCKRNKPDTFEPSIDWQQQYINPTFEDNVSKETCQKNTIKA